MRKGQRILLFGLSLVLLALVPCGAAELVTNGGFETGNFSGWTTIPAPSNSLFGVNTADPHTGTYAAYFGATGSFDDTISQTLNTVAGQSYNVSFWLTHPYGPSVNDFSAYWGTTPLLNLVSVGNFAYTQYSFTETAPTSSTILTFKGLENPAYFYLDDVSVTGPTNVPEPLSLLLFGLGLLGISAIKRATGKGRYETKTRCVHLLLALCAAGGLLLTPGDSFAQVTQPGIQIFDDDVNGISVNLYPFYYNSSLVITQETASNPGSVIWDFNYLSPIGGPASYSYNIYEVGTNLQNPPASALSDTLYFSRSGGGPVPATGHLEFYSGALNESVLLSPLLNATAILETGSLQTPPNGPPILDLSVFQFQSDLDAPTNVPEPYSLALLGFGFMGLGVARRMMMRGRE